MNKMRVMQVIPAVDTVGGAEMFSLELSSNFDSSKVDVLYVCLYPKPKETTLNNYLEKLNVVYLDKRKGFDIKCLKKLRKLIKKYKPHVINTHIYSLLYAFVATMGLKNKPMIFHTMHSIAEKEAERIKRKLYFRIFRTKRCVPVSISDEVTESIKRVYKLDEVECIYNGIDYKKFVLAKKIGKREYEFIHVGRFSYPKNHELLINAFSKVLKEYPNVKLVLLGDGELRNEIVDQINSLNLFNNILLLGSVNNDEVAKYLAKSYYFLLPSRYEGNPISLLEAMAAGCVPICTCVGGMKNIIVDGKNGFFVEGNEDSLSDMMISVLENSIFTEELSSKITDEISVYDIKNVGNKYLILYEKYLKSW